ncbi:hypothetical protein ACJMK2_037433 [Sinanodonta woodiana]|uniref:ATP-binding cassette sub-family D member 4 n=1 Tax=Sinanodonta woodiana TaxID=1069815 RepID=A0ABD3WKB4_SINWO
MDLAPDRGGRQAPKVKFDLVFFKRFLRLFSWFFPSWKSIPVLLFVFLLSLGLLEQYVIYNIGLIPSKYYKILGDKDHGEFWKQTGIAVALILTEAFIKSTSLFVVSLLYITWRGSVCTKLHKAYFKDVLYYTLNVIDKSIDNPDQRITQDVDKMCDNFSQIVAPLIISPFTIAYYIYQCSKSTGYLGPVSVLIFFIIATIINKILMSPVVNFVFLKERMEGYFRFKHMQVRVNAESAAFYRAGSTERQKSNMYLERLLNTQKKLVLREYALNFSINVFDYLGSILSYITIGFPIFLGVYNSLSASELSALISKNAFVVIYLISCFTKLIDLSAQVTDLAGTTHRVGQMVEVLGTLNDQQDSTNNTWDGDTQGFGWNEIGETSNTADEISQPTEERKKIAAFRARDVFFKVPDSEHYLCKDLCFQLDTGVYILVTGDSGCGKSSLLRVINGIWPISRGSIDHSINIGPHTLLFLPQKPYFTDGSLRQQVLFPLKGQEEKEETLCGDDDLIYKYLDAVKLSHLLQRLGGLDVVVDWNWYDELSPGEMQRLSFVRLFYHKPRFAVLDEATSQVGLDAEKDLYRMCRELNITVMSVGHRDSLRECHDIELHLDGKGGWSLRPISGLKAN